MTKKQNNQDRKYYEGNFTKVKALGAGQFEGIVATSSIDRHGESLSIVGLDVSAYMETNPIVLFGHDYWDAESVIGRAINLTKTKNGELLSRFELFTAENPKAALVSKLIKKGVLALSIGFIPTEIEGDTYTKSEMVEYSVVPVPANAEAAITARSLGLNKKEAELYTQFLKTKDITVSKKEDVETKGAVADELAEEAMWDLKRANIRPVCDIWWAFCDVYYSQDTLVEAFDALLKETIGLLTQVLAGTYTEPSEDEEMDSETYPVTYSLKQGVDETRIKELVDALWVTNKASEVETKDADVDVETTTKKSIAGDEDVTALQNFVQDFSIVADKMIEMKSTLNSMAAQKDAGGAPSDLEGEEDQATGNNPDGMHASNTVKEAEKKELTDETKEKANEEVELDVLLKGDKLDLKDVDANTILQLAETLKQKAVELEEDAKKLAPSTTKGENSPTVRKRKLVLKKARKNVVTVDKLVELTLQQLPH